MSMNENHGRFELSTSKKPYNSSRHHRKSTYCQIVRIKKLHLVLPEQFSRSSYETDGIIPVTTTLC